MCLSRTILHSLIYSMHFGGWYIPVWQVRLYCQTRRGCNVSGRVSTKWMMCSHLERKLWCQKSNGLPSDYHQTATTECNRYLSCLFSRNSHALQNIQKAIPKHINARSHQSRPSYLVKYQNHTIMSHVYQFVTRGVLHVLFTSFQSFGQTQDHFAQRISSAHMRTDNKQWNLQSVVCSSE